MSKFLQVRIRPLLTVNGKTAYPVYFGNVRLRSRVFVLRHDGAPPDLLVVQLQETKPWGRLQLVDLPDGRYIDAIFKILDCA